MRAPYADIHALIEQLNEKLDPATPPISPHWYDANGVPRFAPHHPKLCADIYAKEVALVQIRCQSCQKQFLVQFSVGHSEQSDWYFGRAWIALRNKTELVDEPLPTLRDSIVDGSIHYGDPPFHYHDHDEQACAGNTMNCEDILVLEYWHQPHETELRQDEGSKPYTVITKWADWTREGSCEIALSEFIEED